MHIKSWKSLCAVLAIVALLGTGLPVFATTGSAGDNLSAINNIVSMVWAQLGLVTAHDNGNSVDAGEGSPEGVNSELPAESPVGGSQDLGPCINPDG